MKKTAFSLLLLLLFSVLNAQTWNWIVANGANNSRYSYAQCVLGPDTKDNILWEDGALFSHYPHPVFTKGDTMITDRVHDYNDPLHGSYIVAYNIIDGTELWKVELPIDPSVDNFRSKVCGISDSLVFATRCSNSNQSYLYALDIEDGSVVWHTDDVINLTSSEGVIYADNGDILVGDYNHITRFNVNDGSTVWQSPRSSPTSGGSEIARYQDHIYAWAASVYGPKITVFDVNNGDFLYESRGIGGGIVQQIAPLVGPDGTIYAPRAQNAPTADTLVAFEDTGTELKELWKLEMAWVPHATHGVGPDGSFYMYSRDFEILRVVENKKIIASSKPISNANNNNGKIIKINNQKASIVKNEPGYINIRHFPKKDYNPIDTSIYIGDPNASYNSPSMAIDNEGNLFVANENNVFAFDYQLNTIWTENISDVDFICLAKNGNLIVPAENNVIKVYEGRGNICTGPQLDYTIPVNGATDVAYNSEVSATFDVELTEEDLSGVTITPDPGNINAAVSGYTVTISHDDFDSNTEYTATIPEGAVSDGTSLLIYDVVWSFTTIEETYSVTFSVTDGTNPIENANVQVPDLSVDDYTDANGELIIQDVAAGSYDYTVSANDYVPFSDNFEVIDENIIVEVVLDLQTLEQLSNNISIYPNPVQDKLNIISEKSCFVEISNINGKILIIKHLTKKNNNTINTHKLEKGVYIIKIFQKRNIFTKKIIKI